MKHILKRTGQMVQNFLKHVSHPEEKTFYPEVERKSNFRILLDNIWWILKSGKINHYYYTLGLDRKSIDFNDYMDEKTFQNMRNKYNFARVIGGRRAEYLCMMADKFVFGTYLQSVGIPTPKILGIYRKGDIFWTDSHQHEPLDKLSEHEGLDVFMKDAMGECGMGVFHLKVVNGQLLVNDEVTGVDELRNMLGDRYIVQERIIQHEAMNRLYPLSVNTVRVVTAQNGDDIDIISIVSRVGASGHRYDNWSSGGLATHVDFETGTLGEYGAFKDEYGRKSSIHPDTQVPFKGFQIPLFQECLDLARLVHRFFYGVHSVGWDLAITDKGPVILEANEHWHTQFSQIHDNKVKARYLATLEKFGKNVL